MPVKDTMIWVNAILTAAAGSLSTREPHSDRQGYGEPLGSSMRVPSHPHRDLLGTARALRRETRQAECSTFLDSIGFDVLRQRIMISASALRNLG